MKLSDLLDERLPEYNLLVERSKRQLSAAQNLLKSVRTGAMRDVDKLSVTAGERIEDSRKAFDAIRRIDFDTEEYLGPAGGFYPELESVAQEIGLRLFVRDGIVFCYPVLVKTDPSDLSVRIDKKKVSAIRPSALALQLKALQQKGAKPNYERIGRSLAKAYPYAAAHRNIPLGGDVLLTDIYDVLTISPDVKKDYSLLDFTRDIYLLDASGLDQFSGQRLSFSASTATREAKGSVLRFVDRDGHEKVYARIRFVPDAHDERTADQESAELELAP